MFSSKQSRFLVTETDAQSIGGSGVQPARRTRAAQAGRVRVHLARRGDDRVLALAHPAVRHRDLLGRRAAAQPRARARLPRARRGSAPSSRRSARPARRLRARRGCRDPLVDRQPLRPRVQPAASPTPTGTPDRASYQRIVDAFHRGVVDAGAQARILHTGAGARARRGRARGAVPGARRARRSTSRPTPTSTCCATTPPPAGTSSIGIRTGYGDEEARARVAVAPDRLHEAAGVHYEEFSNLRARRRRSTGRAGSARGIRRRRGATLWADGLISDGADVLARYRHPRFSDFPAVTTNAHGAGRITVVGTRAVARARRGPRALGRARRRSPTGSPPAAPCPSPSRRARCPTADAPGSSSTGAGSRRRSRSRASVDRPGHRRHPPGGHRTLPRRMVDADLRRRVSRPGIVRSRPNHREGIDMRKAPRTALALGSAGAARRTGPLGMHARDYRRTAARRRARSPRSRSTRR